MFQLVAVAVALASSGQSVQDHILSLHKSAPLIDGHNDLPWEIRKSGMSAAAFRLETSKSGVQTDIGRLRRGLVGGVFWSVWVPTSLSGSDAVRVTREQIEKVKQMAKSYPGTFQMAYSATDVWTAFRAGRIACLIGMEGGHSINGSIEILRDMYSRGARYMTLTHSKNVPWADSATDTPVIGGLSQFGVRVVRAMNEMGMIVDLSHVSPDTMKDVLRCAKAPVIFSHSSARAVCDHPRNVPDDVLRLLKSNGGVVMVTFVPSYVGAYPSLSKLVDHIVHIRRVAGIDHVGIGSDFDGGGGVPGLEDVSKFPNITAELIRRGFSDAEIRKVLGENVLRVMKAVERAKIAP